MTPRSADFSPHLAPRLQSGRFIRGVACDIALIADNTTTTYGDLTASIAASAVPERAIVALVGEFNLPTVSALFALWNQGCVVVPMLTLNETRCEIAAVEYIVENGKISPLPSGGEGPGERGPKPFLYTRLKGPGLVLFTSGSTGTPKAALHDVSRWLENSLAPAVVSAPSPSSPSTTSAA